MKKLLILLPILLLGCSPTRTERKTAVNMAKNYCSCHEGVFMISFGTEEYGRDFRVYCNNRLSYTFRYTDILYPSCKVK